MKIFKFVRSPKNQIVIFPITIQHVAFTQLQPVAAGFCEIDFEKRQVTCYGESMTLKIKADKVIDSEFATGFLFGAAE